MSKDKKSDGSIPEHVINNLNEFTIGGFVLFYFNSENGLPEHIVNFDSPAHCLALQKYMSDWASALQQINIDSAKASIINSVQNSEEPPSSDGNNLTNS